MLDELAAVCRRQSSVNLANKPLVVVEELQDLFPHNGFRILTPLSREAGEFGFQITADVYFHISSG